MDKFEKSFAFIAQFIRSLLPKAQFTRASYDHLRIDCDGVSAILTFGLSILADLESVLTGNLPVKYSTAIKNKTRFEIYLGLGSQGMIPHVKMSEEMLADEREWLKSVHLDTRFNAKLAERLYVGLQTLEAYLARTLTAHGDIPEVRLDLEVVRSLTSWYQRNKHLNSPDAQRDSLSYLKAAAVLSIIELEDKKASTAAARIKLRYDEEIFSLVREFASEPYAHIELPEALFDYIAECLPTAPRPNPMASADQQSEKQVQLDVMLNRLDPRFVERRHGAWKALHSDNPDRVSQAANSMVELLNQVIGTVCNGAEFKDFLTIQMNSEADSKWVMATRAFIAETKSNLHTVKHHTQAQSKQLAEDLFNAAEAIMRLILK